LHFDFNEKESSFGVVVDKSNYHNDGKIAPISFGLGPPDWGDDFGVQGGGYYFTASQSTACYLECRKLTGINDITNGSISLWMNVDASGENPCIPICITNGFVSTKTELSVSVEKGPDLEMQFRAKLVVDGLTYWDFSFNKDGLELQNDWVCLILTHSGSTNKAYLQGLEADVTYKTQEDKSKWIKSLFESSVVNKADRIMVGGAPRNYSPFIDSGYSGSVDEIKVWRTVLSAEYADIEYEKYKTT
jgi:hypothetical protein